MHPDFIVLFIQLPRNLMFFNTGPNESRMPVAFAPSVVGLMCEILKCEAPSSDARSRLSDCHVHMHQRIRYRERRDTDSKKRRESSQHNYYRRESSKRNYYFSKNYHKSNHHRPTIKHIFQTATYI